MEVAVNWRTMTKLREKLPDATDRPICENAHQCVNYHGKRSCRWYSTQVCRRENGGTCQLENNECGETGTDATARPIHNAAQPGRNYLGKKHCLWYPTHVYRRENGDSHQLEIKGCAGGRSKLTLQPGLPAMMLSQVGTNAGRNVIRGI